MVGLTKFRPSNRTPTVCSYFAQTKIHPPEWSRTSFATMNPMGTLVIPQHRELRGSLGKSLIGRVAKEGSIKIKDGEVTELFCSETEERDGRSTARFSYLQPRRGRGAVVFLSEGKHFCRCLTSSEGGYKLREEKAGLPVRYTY